MSKIRHLVSRHFHNLPGVSINRKIVVFESDDWGSIRMPSKEVYKKCLKAGYKVDKVKIERYDSLASQDDLTLLFDLLSSYKDQNNNPPIFTANCLVTNPDFEKIEASGFEEYHYELITDTFKKYPNHDKCFDLWLDGLKEKVFFPQSHGREHLNVSVFMNDLKKGDKDVHFGFKNSMPGLMPLDNYLAGNKYVQTLYYHSEEDKNEKLKIILEGLDIFEKLFGYKSTSIAPPNYIWPRDYNPYVLKKGVTTFQGVSSMLEPNFQDGFNTYKSVLGKKNELGQFSLVRNCYFEPATSNSTNTLDDCLVAIAAAFRMNKPAIINTHRVNYVGHLDESNRDRSLLQLKRLIESILKKWPEVEFLTSNELTLLYNK
jgi:hypothetical protein